jgi:hypothetical protein
MRWQGDPVSIEPQRRTRAPVVICLPSSDVAFGAAIEAVLERMESLAPDDLQDQVRRVYPQAIIRRRHLSGERLESWYAYRDGACRPRADERWFEEPGIPWARVDPATEQMLETNAEFVALFGNPGDVMVGRNVRDFIAPGTDAISDRVRRAVAQAGGTDSLGTGQRVDGKPIIVEWAARTIDGSIHAWYRPVLVATGAAEPHDE